MDICSRFGKSGLQDVDDLTDIKQAILLGYLDEDNDESDEDENSDVELYGEHGTDESMTPHGAPSDEEDAEFEVALQRIFFEETITVFNLVSAMKGSREKQGVGPEKRTVTWAPDVYDPEPTTEFSAIWGTKQKKSRKNIDEKYCDSNKSGRKGNKGGSSSRGAGSSSSRGAGSSSSRGAGSSKDKKQFRRNKRGSNVEYDF